MDIIQKFLPLGDNCVCGRVHTEPNIRVISGQGVIKNVVDVIRDLGCKKPFIVADKNTYKVAGERVEALLNENGIKYSKYVFDSDFLEPDEWAVGSLIMHFDKSCDLVIGVGSGVINDLSKILAGTSKRQYVIVATAPSMDGYASGTSSVNRDRLKMSLNSKCADVIIGDIDVLKNAPMRMLKAGLGDMLAKYVSILEWKIASIVEGEYICERTANAVKVALKKCVDNAEGLLARDVTAVSAVFDGLVLSGAAMAYVGLSRPASGVEHYFSHVWDMRGVEFDKKVDLHGNQCAVGTIIANEFYHRLLSVTPSVEKGLNYVKEFDYEKHAEWLRGFFGKGAESMIRQEETEKKYDKARHEKRIVNIVKNWDRIKELIETELPTVKEMEDLYDRIEMPKTLQDVGVAEDIKYQTFIATKDIRDKYVLSKLVWDLGIIESFK